MKFKFALIVTMMITAICLVFSPAAQAQNLYAAIHGTVTDASGAVVPNAAVTAVNNAPHLRARE